MAFKSRTGNTFNLHDLGTIIEDAAA